MQKEWPDLQYDKLKDTIATTFPNIECFPVARVNEPIDVISEFIGYANWKALSHFFVTRCYIRAVRRIPTTHSKSLGCGNGSALAS